MLIDILYIVFGITIIAVVSILLKRKEVQLKKKLSEIQNQKQPYVDMVSSTKAKLSRDIKRIKRQTGNQG